MHNFDIYNFNCSNQIHVFLKLNKFGLAIKFPSNFLRGCWPDINIELGGF